MAIANAIPRGSSVYVYDEHGRQIFSISSGTGANNGLLGFTSSTVSVRRGSSIYTYDDQGRQIYSMTS